MTAFPATRLLVVLAWCAMSALPAQQATPRFVLPEEPYDYAPVAAPGLAAHFSLPGRNGTIPSGGCGSGSSTPPAPPPPDRTNALAALGRVLFYDPLLSRNQTRSCGSCHHQARAFADGKAHSRGFGGQSTRRNSMSIANLGLLDRGFFWDARAETLELMVVMPRSCAGCHVERRFQGCYPDHFTIEAVSLQSEECRNNGIDRGRESDDPGLGRVTGKAEDRGKFRAPSLRNVELTGPYMHDGRFATLEQVMQFYSDRVTAHPNLDAALRHDAGRPGWGQAAGTPAPVDLTMGAVATQRLGVPLSSRERADLVSFLKTLTDHELVRDPRFADPFVRRSTP